MYDYNCPDCNEAKLQSDKNARKINEIIGQLNQIVDNDIATTEYLLNKADKIVGEEAKIKVNEELGDIKDKTNDIQQQVNNLVLGAVGDGNNAEVIQARGKHVVLNDRLSENENNFNSITLKIESKNKYNCNSINNIIGQYLDYKGILYEQSKTTVTHFINVKDGDVIRFIKNTNTSTNYGALYATDGTFISNIKTTHNLTESNIKIDNWNKTLVTFTVPSDVSVSKIKLNLETSNNNKYNMVTINQEMPTTFDEFISDYKINGEKIDIVKNELIGKIAIFNGDSICNGISGIDENEPTYGWGWAGRIGTKNNMIWKNYGIAGGTVCSGTYNWTWVSNTNNLDWKTTLIINV